MNGAEEIVARAQQRARQRLDSAPRVDYNALNRMVRRQRAALTRAKKSGNAAKVIVACRDAVKEWNQPGAMWPDDWSMWQRALDDVLPWSQQVRLEDLS